MKVGGRHAGKKKGLQREWGRESGRGGKDYSNKNTLIHV